MLQQLSMVQELATGSSCRDQKRGGGKMNISYNMYNAYQTPTYLPKYADAVGYMKLKNEAYYNANNNVGHFSQYKQEQIDLTAAGTDPDRYPNTDWYKRNLQKNGQCA